MEHPIYMSTCSVINIVSVFAFSLRRLPVALDMSVLFRRFVTFYFGAFFNNLYNSQKRSFLWQAYCRPHVGFSILKYLVNIVTALLKSSDAVFVVFMCVVLYDFRIKYAMKVNFSYRVVSIALRVLN